ncbi:MAG: 30S ribosomal protein S6 [Armatimonadetes bacterium]|nr:30S ribosomal protein S6 [Armatimonadota bacterium]
MRNYEMVAILDPDLGEEDLNAVVEKCSKQVVALGGEVVSEDRWGKKRLAYELKNQKEGIYVLFNLKTSTESASELERWMRITDKILKCMIVRQN